MRSGSFDEHPVDLAELVTETVAENRLLADGTGVTLRTRLAAGPLVYAEPAGLARAVGNLLSNAVHVAPPGSEVTVALGSTLGWAWIAVRDTGPGIAEADRTAILERFRRTPATSDRRSNGGAGLGLAIARQIVESHQGRITLISELGVGSTFVVWLPDRAVSGLGERPELPPDVDPLGAATHIAR